jgi:hypothetical protein
VTVLLLALAFNIGLHALYGAELFLYSANWTFLVVALVGLGATLGHPPGSPLARVITGGTILLAACEAINNGRVVLDLVRLYEG